MKKIIAIIGVSNGRGSIVAQKLIEAGYRVLLMDSDINEANLVLDKIRSNFQNADAEVQECSLDVAWQADVIFPFVSTDSIEQLANKIKSVVTCKVIIALESEDNFQQVQMFKKFLPYSKIVRVINNINTLEQKSDFKKSSYSIISDDRLAANMVYQLIQDAGFSPLIITDQC